MKLEHISWGGAARPREGELRARLAAAGFAASRWSDPPGAAYPPHQHDHDESLWLLRGTLRFEIAGRSHALAPGDRLMLPGGTVHAALAGPEGATYLIGRRSVRTAQEDTCERPSVRTAQEDTCERRSVRTAQAAEDDE